MTTFEGQWLDDRAEYVFVDVMRTKSIRIFKYEDEFIDGKLAFVTVTESDEAGNVISTTRTLPGEG